MNVRTSCSELLSVATLAVFVGVVSHRGVIVSECQGRAAYLASYSKQFDKDQAHPPSALGAAGQCLLLALGTYVLYKGLAWVYGKILSSLPFGRAQNS